MAVTIKKKALTLTSLVTRLFETDEAAVELQKAQEMEMLGCSLLVSPTTFSVAASGNAHVLGKVSLKSETVTLCIKGKLGLSVRNMIKAKVKDLINNSFQKYLDMGLIASVTKPAPVKPTAYNCYDEVMQAYNTSGNGNKVAAIKKLRELMGNSLKEAKDQVEAWLDTGVNITPEKTPGTPPKMNVDEIKLQQQTTYPVELDLNASPVHMKNATKLNQPVTGTSGGSIYHVIAIGDNCVVAVRIKGNNEIAIRAEVTGSGDGALKAASGLKFSGLEKKPAGHWSLHLDPEDFAMVKRSIGSTIMAMSIPFWGVNTDLHSLQGVGK